MIYDLFDNIDKNNKQDVFEFVKEFTEDDILNNYSQWKSLIESLNMEIQIQFNEAFKLEYDETDYITFDGFIITYLNEIKEIISDKNTIVPSDIADALTNLTKNHMLNIIEKKKNAISN